MADYSRAFYACYAFFSANTYQKTFYKVGVMNREQQKKLIEYLAQFTTENKLHKMEQVLAQRTRHVTVVLEDIYQAHNMSAAVRSAECFGIQDVHIIEQRNRFAMRIGVSKGASNWVTIHRHKKDQVNNVKACFDRLHEQGYWIVATSPHANAYTLSELPIDKKIALVFGNEDAGISNYVQEYADASVAIPMYGFTESFNISVSVALCLYDLITRIRSSDSPWHLTDEEKLDIQLQWLRSIVRGSESLETKILNQE